MSQKMTSETLRALYREADLDFHFLVTCIYLYLHKIDVRCFPLWVGAFWTGVSDLNELHKMEKLTWEISKLCWG